MNHNAARKLRDAERSADVLRTLKRHLAAESVDQLIRAHRATVRNASTLHRDNVRLWQFVRMVGRLALSDGYAEHTLDHLIVEARALLETKS